MRKKPDVSPEEEIREEDFPVFRVDASDIPIEPNGNPLRAGRKIARTLRPFEIDTVGFGKKSS